MVIGGGSAPNDVEIVDLSGNRKRCRKPVNYPIKWASHGKFVNGFASVCGGLIPSTNECYKYDAEVIK